MAADAMDNRVNEILFSCTNIRDVDIQCAAFAFTTTTRDV